MHNIYYPDCLISPDMFDILDMFDDSSKKVDVPCQVTGASQAAAEKIQAIYRGRMVREQQAPDLDHPEDPKMGEIKKPRGTLDGCFFSDASKLNMLKMS